MQDPDVSHIPRQFEGRRLGSSYALGTRHLTELRELPRTPNDLLLGNAGWWCQAARSATTFHGMLPAEVSKKTTFCSDSRINWRG